MASRKQQGASAPRVERAGGRADVLILGAGTAGLAAAQRLSAAGLGVVVLEARERSGGRVWTTHTALDPVAVELGAEFVHGEARELVELSAAARAPLVELTPTHWLRRGGALEQARGYGALLERALTRAARIAARGPDRSFAAALAESHTREPGRTRALAFVEGFHAARAERISARALAVEDTGLERLRRVLPGFDRLTCHLAASLPAGSVRTGTEVIEVRWAPGGVELQCRSPADGSTFAWVAPKLVSTAPPSTLARADGEPGLRFAPPLEAKARALAHLAMGPVVRLTLLFQEPFWQSPGLLSVRKGHDLARMLFLHAPDEPFPTWWTSAPLHAPMLTAWAGGSKALALAGAELGALSERALGSLARILGVSRAFLDGRCSAAHFHDWTADPFARGAYSYPMVGGEHAARELAAPLAGTLFFAGEATCPPPDNATVHGALASGLRAAREVLASLET